MQKAKRLIIAPWGNPYGWVVRKYKLAVNGKEIEDESRTSLGLLAKAYSSDDFLVFVLDTVYSAFYNKKSGCEPRERNKSCPISYEDLITSVKIDIENWIRECASSEKLVELLNLAKLDIVIVPGIGSYDFEGITYQFSLPKPEPAGLFASWVATSVLRKLLDIGPEEVIVDLTHGLNYMPVALMEAVELALKVYSVAFHRDVKLIVYESEPFSKVDSLNLFSPKILDIRYKNERDILAVFFKRQPERAFNAKYFSFAYRIDKELGVSQELSRINDLIRGLKRNLGKEGDLKGPLPFGMTAANIVLYSMPLAAVYLAYDIPDTSYLLKVCDYLNELCDFSVKYGKIDSVNDSKCKVYPAIVLNWDAVRILLLSAAFLESTLRIRLEMKKRGLIRFLELYERGVSREELKDILRFLGELYRPIAKAELGNLKRCCLDSKKGNECRCEIEVNKGGWPNKNCVKSFDPRHLRAHAGLEKNLIEGRIDKLEDKEDLILRYRDLECWEKLKNKLDEKNF
ncbi:CRISPR-associated protein, MJ1666 family [Thermovibrio ammonificans HB-1]|uniref:CRISPR-associated protein, MJ1666 family n=1 Tax=Thermovibrio ammonificans (strain DSM 15698 / JCM 12110 / HB-1) TaxID=648996 RepID=E8T699_THEA1|nr:CRISPR-associated CARF protein Csx1 [Thermovibrio ammonificans]ADU96683.1 CRISPR-associated protein, MJ1666 family [Thermovibrio ammonificans HB-1]